MSNILKPIRIILSLLFLFLFSFLFLDGWTDIGQQYSIYFTDLQIIPYFMRWQATQVFFFGGGLLMLLLTGLFGRVYCSTICPLGTWFDVAWRVRRWVKRKSSLGLLPGYPWLRYGIFIILIISVLYGSTVFLIFLDPFSISGRLYTQLFRPLFTSALNAGADILQGYNYYGIKPLDWKFSFSPAFGFAVGWTVLLAILALWKGRLYCNTLCPIGTLLGLLSRVSLYRIRIAENRCTLCGDCLTVCKAGCIDMKTSRLDFSRCVGCMNCLQVCQRSAISFQRERGNQVAGSASRRKMIKNGLMPVLALQPVLSQAVASSPESELPLRKAICPPGSLGRDYFTSHCTACHLCISQCPTRVLQPSCLEYGIEGIFQPKLDFSINFCSYECNLCSQICPTGAIAPLTLAEKKQVQMGKARFIKHLCIVDTKGTHCGACSEHCPTKACDMVPYKGNLSIPLVNVDICTGCGACEYACPTKPKSIVVDENPIHLLARLPVKNRLDPAPDKQEDSFEEFPF